MTTAMDLARAYFDAWNGHDSAALRGVFAQGGTYSDPVTNGPVTGEAIVAYAENLWTVFPDLAFELASIGSSRPTSVVAEWTMTGTQDGPFNGLPPSGKSVRVAGVDIIEASDSGLSSVTGYFDSAEVPKQLGLQVIVQPERLGPFAFGNSVAVQTGRKVQPGAFSITTIWNDASQDQEVRELSVAAAREMLEMEGFIGLTLVRVAGRGITVSAWEKPEQARQLRASGAHRQAMARFWSDIGDAAFTSVWAPERYNPLWVRCTSCGKMGHHEKDAGRCGCGEALPEAPAYF